MEHTEVCHFVSHASKKPFTTLQLANETKTRKLDQDWFCRLVLDIEQREDIIPNCHVFIECVEMVFSRIGTNLYEAIAYQHEWTKIDLGLRSSCDASKPMVCK